MSLRTAVPAVLLTSTLLSGALAVQAGSAQAASDPVSHTRVIGGYLPDASQWPWMAGLLDDSRGTDDFSRQFCGGALVAPRVVVTAAHCVTDKNRTPRSATGLSVVLGKRRLSAAGGEHLPVVAVRVHPQYGTVNGMDHDVAELVLGQPSAQTPATLVDPATVLHEGDLVTTMGWGRTSGGRTYDYLRDHSDDLKAVDSAVWSDAHCAVAGGDADDQGVYRRLYQPETMICAGDTSRADTTCQGDSGSPMMRPDGAGGWQLVGVVSWGGFGCSGVMSPSVYGWLGARSMQDHVRAAIAEADRSVIGTGQPGTGAGVVGASPSGATGPSAGSGTTTAAPRLGSLSVLNRIVRPGGAVRVRLSASQAGTVVLTVAGAGRTVSRWTVRVGRGTSVVTLRARTTTRRLARGTYQVGATLAAGGARSATVQGSFRVR